MPVGQGQAIQIEKLQINPGEKIGVLGPVGAGKTTLLRLLSGMYKPQAGMVKLDGIDMAHISKPVLAERVGYLQQEGRLFAGTLRENLVLGLIESFGATGMGTVPTMALAMMEHPDFTGRDLTDLDVLISGGATVPAR